MTKTTELKTKSRISAFVRYSVTVNKEDTETLSKIGEFLLMANDRDNGKKIQFSDIAIHAIKKLTIQDIERIQLDSLTEVEQAELALKSFNEANNTNYSMAQFTLLNISKNTGKLKSPSPKNTKAESILTSSTKENTHELQ